MFDWLKKFGGSPPWKNIAGLESESLALLVEDFAALEKLDPDLPGAVVRYVVDGEGQEVLTRLEGTGGASEALGLARSPIPQMQGASRTPRSRFFQRVECRDPQFFIRLGKTFEAASRASSGHRGGSIPTISIIPQQPAFGDPALRWLEVLIVAATRLTLHSWPRRSEPCALPAEVIEDMLAAEGYPPDLLLRSAFQPQLQRYFGPPFESIFATMKGIGESAVRHKNTLLEALRHPDFKQRVYALEMMKKCKVPAGAFAAELVDLGVGSSKQVRELAGVLLVGIATAARPLLEQKIRAGEPEERSLAARLFWKLEGENGRAFLSGQLASEKNKKVGETIQELIAAPLPELGGSEDALQLPELLAIPDVLPLSRETETAWRECFDQVNRLIGRLMQEKSPHLHRRNLTTLPPELIDRAFRSLQGPDRVESLLANSLIGVQVGREVTEAFKAFWQQSELDTVHYVRFLILIGVLRYERSAFQAYGPWVETLFRAFRRTHPDVGLRELGAAYAAVGLDAGRIGENMLARFSSSRTPFGLAPEQIWPYWAEHLDLLERAFSPAAGDFLTRHHQRFARANAFQVLAEFPRQPKQLLPVLWDLALGPKSERASAQRCLEDASDRLERLTAALASRSADTRMAAAEWLGRLADRAAVPALLAAMRKEGNEAAKGVMMTALEQLSAPVDQFLDRAGLLKEAEKGLSKGVPEDLKWFPFDQLPAVRWLDSGQELQSIVRWWLVQGFKLKNPEPGPLLRRYCASLKPPDREALGQFVLEAWIAEDVTPIDRSEAEKRARNHGQLMASLAQSAYNYAKANPQTQATAQPPLTAEQYYAQALPGLLKQPKGSAISSKGVLSLAGACTGASAAPIVNRYLKEWYGQRAAQCKALLQMLAWVESRTATQLLLAVGSRFRTKGIQEEANKQAEALAERKGWTVAELADRTIPSAGLDENGVLTLDYGLRQFTARLDAQLDFTLADDSGKALKSLPDPRKDDDEAKAAEAKKTLSAARKELKSVLTMQRDRLYEAMCTARTWPFEDWNLYLNQHPIVKHYCQRLAWAVVRDERAVRLFRPLPDGSLTDAADDPVALGAEDQIRLAHECLVTADESQSWRRHLADYNVEVLFEQFGRPNFNLPEERKNETEIDDFRGHLLEAFKLRGRASRFGYTRGQAQDGGWFFDYRKRFPTLGIEAVIEFTGNGLPEENRTVGLTVLHFDRVVEGENFGAEAKMPLAEAPPVLVSECWNDIRTIAAEGTGFDPEWERKTQP